jgi:hypothetical protein
MTDKRAPDCPVPIVDSRKPSPVRAVLVSPDAIEAMGELL